MRGRSISLALLISTVVMVSACGSMPRTAEPASPAEAAAVAEIDAMLDELYDAFCFDAGGEPDWDAMRALFADGAVFYAPSSPGAKPRGVGAEQFLADFRDYATTSDFAASGLHERILHARVDTFGGVAHAYVAFDAFLPGESGVLMRGLDSIQLLRSDGRWLLASFTTQYEAPGLTMPARFAERPR